MQARLQQLRVEAERGRNLAETSQEVETLLGDLEAGDPAHWELRLIRAMTWRVSGRLTEAEAELVQLEPVLLRASASRLLAYARLELARLQFSHGNLVQAEQSLSALLRGGHSSLDPLLDGDAKFLLGRVLAMRGDTWRAEEELNQALAIFHERGDDWRQADAQSSLAMVLVRQGRNFEGIRLWHESLAFHELQGNNTAVTRELERIGYATWCAGDLEQTRRTLLRVLQMYENDAGGKISRSLLATHYNLISLELLDDHVLKAREHAVAASRLALELNDRVLLAGTCLLQAALELVEGAAALALEYCKMAEQTASQVDYSFPVCDQPLLALVYLANGNQVAAELTWPKFPESGLDGAQRMSLRCVRKVTSAMLAHETDPASQSQLVIWDRELELLIRE